jgi:hypothetical protein
VLDAVSDAFRRRRELTDSLRNSLRRRYSTVLTPRKSCAEADHAQADEKHWRAARR